MISSEVQRTLVKSPPELWAELSDPAALARHLGELGEIRITRAEPEKRVEWEAEGTSGSVLIKPSGWGTKVTLSVTREIEAPIEEASEIDKSEANQDDEPPPVAELETSVPDTAELDEPDVAELESEAQTTVAEAEPAPMAAEHTASETALDLTPPSDPAPQPAPRRGFFARLFGRRQPEVAESAEISVEEHATTTVTDSTPTPSIEPSETSKATIVEPPRSSAIESLQARFQAEPASGPVDEDDSGPEAEPEAVAVAGEETSEPVAEAGAPPEVIAEPPRDLAAELKAAEEVAAEEVTAVLRGVLDRLGAAHHRPFSRA
ncbi:MAG TPA: hypothetical protein VHT29_05470 [Solirubrobacteraceae bacterium]|jgi:hypothetical protein|nr:hypothetical protein [Solirubrobacteraceae bacterium]